MTAKKDLLIIFYRNPELGKVKTRLAATLGNTKALEIYLHLAEHTKQITQNLSVDKALYYSHYIDFTDNWPIEAYKKEKQEGEGLGDRMMKAFETAFANNYEKVCIIGTDCLELTPDIILKSYEALNKTDTVLGPAKDGGYYLLGMKSLHRQFFEGKAWSTHTVAHDTMLDFHKLKLSYTLLPMLSDVDVEEDLKGRLL